MKEVKLDGRTPDITQENIDKLTELFPEVATEGKIDFYKLQQLLGEYAEDKPERYNFTWNGKSRALRISQTPSTGTLRPCKEESEEWETTQNLYIEGDNLEVLKLLQKSYHGKVKMIYIDPPYNTGGDFVYKDDFKDNIKNYKEITGQVDGEGKNLSTNAETSGRYHTDWLNMMYPRLRLARNLLSDDGVIFISIDDHEVENLKKLCNELYGENNFVADLIWANKEGGGSSDSKLFRIKHEHILCYAKMIECIEINGVPINNTERYKSVDKHEPTRGKFYLQKLGMGSIQYSSSLDYGIEASDGTPVYPADNNNGKKACWRWSKSKYEWGKDNDFIEIKKDNSGVWTVYTKQYLKCDYDGNIIVRTQRPMGIIEKYSSTQASKLLELIGLGNTFDYSKPVDLIRYLIERLEVMDGTIIDFFAGSAATAHAVMNLNAEDGGKRKFIMVQLPEPCDEKSEAYKAGYMTISEIGKERIRRAGKKIKEEHGVAASNLDVGFKVLKLDNSNIRRWNPDPEDLQTSLEDHLENFVSGRSELDVVYEIMLKYGLDLTYPVEEYDVAGQKVYAIGFGMLMICLGDKITTQVAEGILKLIKELAPESARVVCRDNGFATDSEKTNVKEIFNLGGIEEFISI